MLLTRDRPIKYCTQAVNLLLVGLMMGSAGSFSSVIAAPIEVMQPQSLAQPIFFRTKSYGVQIVWRRGRPYLTVSNNGWRVLANSPVQVSQALSSDRWTTYRGRSGAYRVSVQVGPGGAGAIEVSLDGGRIAKEYAISPAAPVDDRSSIVPNGTLLMVQTPEYAVRVVQHQGKPYLNLYDLKNAKVLLNQVPVTLSDRGQGRVYRYDGETTVQVREDAQGQRSLIMMQENQIVYRGEGR